MTQPQLDLDNKNAEFWNDFCGSGLARQLGIMSNSAADLCRFDEAYFKFYPYLKEYVDRDIAGRQVLEIGLGYGTLGQFLAEKGASYSGVDIAPNPVAMMQHRLGLLGQNGKTVQVASALALPYPDNNFDYVYSIGCLHHTGNVPAALKEIYRVLKPGGKTIVMLYNRSSIRQKVWLPLMRLKQIIARHTLSHWQEQVRKKYDTNLKGEAAPYTEFTSPVEAIRLFKEFSQVKVEKQNFDDYTHTRFRLGIRREWLLNNIAHVAGLDLYITATK